MVKADLIEPALPQAYGSASETGIAAGKVKSDFSHVSNNFSHTQKAIEAFLVSRGVPRHSHTAGLIMFMERSFSGKYRKGERSHYQQIMPSAAWRNGDTLSEKLTRCKDKETFKARFDRVGTTAILKREHFDNREITSLDFKGRMYLRLIDTKRDNLSLFYRNDELVNDFIKSAIVFYQDELRAKKYKTRRALSGKAEGVELGKPEVICLENPKPLLYPDVDSRKPSGKNKGNSLTLVYSSPNGKNQTQPQPRRGRVKKEKSGFGDAEQQIAEECGLVPATEENENAVQRQSSAKLGSGFDVFKMWRNSVLVNMPDVFIHANPTGPEIRQAANFYGRFSEFFPADSIKHFFNHLATNWIGAHKDFAKAKLWGHGAYPAIPWLVMDRNCDHVLTWYREELKDIAKKVEWKREMQERSAQQTESLRPSNDSSTCSVPHRTSDEPPLNGRTFRHGTRLSLEHDIAWSLRLLQGALSPKSALQEKIHVAALRTQLEKLSIDLAASEVRISELLEMKVEEFDACTG
ncbi:MAG: hypothetical protein NTX56_20350 [Proteobacteria bacterium]|nr:hypothetical protein [Pseudomonadota bacterium]